MTSPFLIPDIERDEGCRLTAYQDSVGVWTVGYGHAYVQPGTVWTQATADAQLRADVATAETGLDIHLPWWRTLDDIRQDCLVNQAFNLGVDGLVKFTTYLELVKAGNYAAASQDEMHTFWAKQVGDRATRLAQQMLTGVHDGTDAADPAAPVVEPPVAVVQPTVAPWTPPIPLTPSVPQLPPPFTPAPVAATGPTLTTVATPARVGATVALTGLVAGATAMMQTHIVDLKGLIDLAFVYLASPVALGIVVGLATSLAKMLNINIQGQVAQRVLTATENGAMALVSKAQTAADQSGTITTKNEMIAGVLNYANAAVPDAVKALGLATPAGQAVLANLAEAQVQKAVAAIPTPKVSP
jgi:lysozyme